MRIILALVVGIFMGTSFGYKLHVETAVYDRCGDMVNRLTSEQQLIFTQNQSILSYQEDIARKMGLPY